MSRDRVEIHLATPGQCVAHCDPALTFVGRGILTVLGFRNL